MKGLWSRFCLVDTLSANRVSFDLPRQVASSFPTYLGKIEATLLAGYLVEKGAQGFLFNQSKIVVVKISETCLETLWKVRVSLQGHKAAILFG